MGHKYSFRLGKLRSLSVCAVLGLWACTLVQGVEYRRVARKLYSSPEPLDTQFSQDDLRKLLTILGDTKPETTTTKSEATSEKASAMQHNAMIMPELIRSHSPAEATTPTSATTRVTTRRFFRRIRRKTTTTASPPTAPEMLAEASEVQSSRMLPTGSTPNDMFQQLLLSGILGALNNSTAQTPTNAQQTVSAPNAPPSISTPNANNDNATLPEILALFTGAKSEASSKSEVVVPPPQPPPSAEPASKAQGVDDPTTLALLNYFSSTAQTKDTNENGNNAGSNLLNLVAQSQQAAISPSPVPTSQVAPETQGDQVASALSKLLLQNTLAQSNSVVQPQTPQTQTNPEASAAQLQTLLSALGTLGAASQQNGNMNQLFGQGGDQLAQAQTIAQLFGQQGQQQQSQNLLGLLGGNQGLSNLFAAQSANSIPGLGLLSTVSSLGTTLFSTVSNLLGGGGDGKPRVRGKGVDTRVGLGYRLGNIGDAQVVWDIGPQLYTDALRNEARYPTGSYTQKRESGSPIGTHYMQSASATATEKEMQQIEAKRRMVQAAVQDHYRGNHFASVYPKPSQRTDTPYYSPQASSSDKDSGASSLFSSLPFAEHLKGFWSGLTSGSTASQDHDMGKSQSKYYNFDDVRSDFSANLIKRSSPDYTDFEPIEHHRKGRKDDIDDPTHSTLTEYERMLLQHGKDIGTADTKHGVVEEDSEPSESGFFSKWFKNPFSSFRSSVQSEAPPSPRPSEMARQRDSPIDRADHISEPKTRKVLPQKSVKKSFQHPSPQPISPSEAALSSYENSFHKRNMHRPPRRKAPRPQRRRSHNPFRNWIQSFKHTPQRPRASSSGGFGRRHFQKPHVSANPKLQHFTNTNKDLMMADANDDFVASDAEDTLADNDRYAHPLSYQYANEFPDVALTMPVPPRRVRPTAGATRSQARLPLSQREHIIEPALLYDHLEIEEPIAPPHEEADESFHQRNKVVVNSILREREKQKVLGGPSATPSSTVIPAATLSKIQKLRLQNQKLRLNVTKQGGKHKIIVKVKGNKGAHLMKAAPSGPPHETHSESTTALPSMLSTIGSMFRSTSKPTLLNNLIHNATSMFPSITSIRILPRKKTKEPAKTKLTVQNGKPAIVSVPEADFEDEEYDQDPAADGEESEPLVQMGHDMSFADLQKIFAGQKSGTKRLRLRVKESLLKGKLDDDAKASDKERKDSDEDEADENDPAREIFVDIESGEVSVLKPVASLVSFTPKEEESSKEVDYYEDDDGDGVADADMKRKEHIFTAIQKELVKNFEKMKKAELRAEAKKRRKQELAEKGLDEAIDDVMKFFDPMNKESKAEQEKKILKQATLTAGLAPSM